MLIPESAQGGWVCAEEQVHEEGRVPIEGQGRGGPGARGGARCVPRGRCTQGKDSSLCTARGAVRCTEKRPGLPLPPPTPGEPGISHVQFSPLLRSCRFGARLRLHLCEHCQGLRGFPFSDRPLGRRPLNIITVPPLPRTLRASSSALPGPLPAPLLPALAGSHALASSG